MSNKVSEHPKLSIFATALSRDWNQLCRPPLDHPDQDLLWEGEQVSRDLVELRSDPNVRHAFEQRLTEYIDGISSGAESLLKRNYDIAFIGSKGIGKSTAICKVTGLEVPSPDNAPPKPVLEAGGGGITVCDVHLGTGHGYGILTEPCSEDEMRAHVTDFAEHIKGTVATTKTTTMTAARGLRRRSSAQFVISPASSAVPKRLRRARPFGATTRKNSQPRPAAFANMSSRFLPV